MDALAVALPGSFCSGVLKDICCETRRLFRSPAASTENTDPHLGFLVIVITARSESLVACVKAYRIAREQDGMNVTTLDGAR